MVGKKFIDHEYRLLRRKHISARACFFLVFVVGVCLAGPTVQATTFREVIRDSQKRMVKVYGAGGVSGLEAYQSGFLISAEGHILTAFSYVLDSDTITVTLDDGRKFEARLVGADRRLDIAVLKIDAADLPYFDLKEAATGAEGTRVLALSNLFGVATGEEAVSVLHGSIAAVTTLEARRGAYKMPYEGPVYVLDAMTNNPGAAGGALTDMRGKLLGILGKELRSEGNNIWLNYALPAGELVEAVEAIKAGQVRPDAQAGKVRPKNPWTLADLGLVLVPNVLERTPSFVDTVRPDSPAAKAGIHADDLIVFINNQLVQSCNAVSSELQRLDRETDVKLVLLRSGKLMEVTLKLIP